MNLTGAETQEVNERYAQMVADNTLQDKNSQRLLRELSENSLSDIEDNQTLSMKDFSLEAYRQDLLEYFEKHKEFFRKMPCGVYSGFQVDPDAFPNIPESIVAVVGYPHREEGSKKRYQKIYLMCQPIDSSKPVSHKGLNQAEILDFLRRNKKVGRYIPEWVESNNRDKFDRLSQILKDWMQAQLNIEVVAEAKDIRRLLSQIKAGVSHISLDEKFQLEKFDLILWEYISTKNYK